MMVNQTMNRVKPKIDPVLLAKSKNRSFQIQHSLNDGVGVQLFVSATKLPNLGYIRMTDA